MSEEKRGKIIILVIGYEQSSTQTKILGISNVFLNTSLTSCLALEPIFSQTHVSEDKLALKFQFSPEIQAKPTEDYRITSSIGHSLSTSSVAESPCFAAGSTQDVMQKTVAAHPQGRGQGLPLPGDDFRLFVEYVFLTIWLGSSWDLPLLSNINS